MSARPAVLVIAGSDSSGGAGLTRDLQVLRDFRVDALCAVTAITAQSHTQVSAVHHVPPAIVRAQIRAALDSREIGAIKIGMLGTGATVEAVADSLPAHRDLPIVLDPVLVSSSGGVLLDGSGIELLIARLFPRVMLLTPNVPEAAALLEQDTAMDELTAVEQAKALLHMGPEAVLIKGGHSPGEEAVDWLVSRTGEGLRLASARVNATRRGTGCALASAVAAGLALGTPLAEACRLAKRYVLESLMPGTCSNR